MSLARIFHFGAFDHDNYGDLLFPLLLERQLADLPAEIIHVSPTGAAVSWQDALPTISFAEAFSDSRPVTGVVVGGGDIINSGDWRPPGSVSLPRRTVLPGLWLGASALAERHGAALAWNGPGMAQAMPEWARSHLRRAARYASPLTVRDQSSATWFKNATSLAVSVIPDTAFALASLWSLSELSRVAEEYLDSRGLLRGTTTLAVFVGSGRHDDNELPAILSEVARSTQLTPVLLEICPWQSRRGFLSSLATRVGHGALAVEAPDRLRLVAALIATSQLYLGESLHGLITAVTYGKPAIVVPPKNLSNHKFAATAALTAPLSRFVSNWSEVSQLLAGFPLSFPSPGHPLPREISHSLAAHDKALLERLKSRPLPVSKKTQQPLIPLPLARYWSDAEAADVITTSLQLFWAADQEEFSEDRSIQRAITKTGESKLRVSLPPAARYRLDPACHPGFAIITLTVLTASPGRAPTRTSLSPESIIVGGTALSHPDKLTHIWAYGDDPQLAFFLPAELAAAPAELEIVFNWDPLILNRHPDGSRETLPHDFARVWQNTRLELAKRNVEVEASTNANRELTEERNALIANVANEKSHNHAIAAELEKREAALNQAQIDRRSVKGELETISAQLHARTLSLAAAETALADAQIQHRDLTAKIMAQDAKSAEQNNLLSAQDTHIRHVKRSLSWKIATPLRFMENLISHQITAARTRLATCSFNLESDLGPPGLARLHNPFRITGWFFDSDGSPASLVHIRIGHHTIPCHSTDRPDVVAYFKKLGRDLPEEQVGFTAEIKANLGLHHIVIEAVCADGVVLRLQRRFRWLARYKPRGNLGLAQDDQTFPAEIQTHPVNAPDLRAIAFYLPQYHTIPENDLWWGEGFTEWTNVRPALPKFEGHHQPHVPHPNLGYYDLSEAAVLEKQASMARAAGIYGFCFYYYWFGGKRLLEQPLETMLETGRPDLPFCYCWANENWSRRWDGLEAEILIAQALSPADDDAVIRDLMRAFRDPRYIRVEGRPMLLVYRPKLLPDPGATFLRWRELCRNEGIGEIHLAGVKGAGCSDAAELGLDALVEFPPNDSGPLQLTTRPQGLAQDFKGKLYDYLELRHLCLQLARPARPLYRGVTPSWDNTARRKNRGSIFLHSSPGAYHNWLQETVTRTRAEPNPEHRILFINAWNEWAEGCHLEPDEKHGYAWLNATRAVLGAWPRPASRVDEGAAPLLVISHDANLAGAQNLLLTMLRSWRVTNAFRLRIICVGDGPLRTDFEKVAPTLVLADYSSLSARRAALAAFTRQVPSMILSSTVVNGPLLAELTHLQIPIFTYCHELQQSIEHWAPGEIMAATLRHTHHFIAGSDGVAQNLTSRHGVPADRIDTRRAFIEPRPPVDLETRTALQAELSLQVNDIVVVGVGTTDWRKGVDLFTEVALLACAKNPLLKFFWIGGDASRAQTEIQGHPLEKRIRFLGNRPESRRYYAIAHIFALTSREDPCPLVALEAADAALPVVCFAGAGDIPAVLGPEAAVIVPFGDAPAFAHEILSLSIDAPRRLRLGRACQQRIASDYHATTAAATLAAMLRTRAPLARIPLVSVIIPNYNHAPYLEERLQSVANQTIRDIEIILLDDASTDHSAEILNAFAVAEPRARYLPNFTNSGSTFKQWKKGLRAARGKYVWIAESDDSARPELLERLVARLEEDPSIALACCQLRMMDTAGNLGGTPDEWFGELDPVRWKNSFTNDGDDEIARYLSRKNTLLNASGVVFRRFDDVDELADDTMRLCADWLFWSRLLARGKIAYEAEPLNHWRLQSSNARTRPPGELEWTEGSRVITEIALLCGASETEREAMLARFAARCEQWRAVAAGSSL